MTRWIIRGPRLRALTTAAAAAAITASGAPAQDNYPNLSRGIPSYNSHSVADSRLHSEMYSVGRWLENYCTMNYKFPWQQDDVNYAQSQLVELAPVNPYQSSVEYLSGSAAIPNVGQPGAEIRERDRNRIQLKLDYNLSRYMVREWSQDPPDEWQESPGTITALSNNKDMFVVWGAGADGRPIRDDLSGKPVLVVGRWASGSQDQDTSTDTSSDTDSSD